MQALVVLEVMQAIQAALEIQVTMVPAVLVVMLAVVAYLADPVVSPVALGPAMPQ